jgi:glycosyltransferase involved in cell wall biosynthesis
MILKMDKNNINKSNYILKYYYYNYTTNVALYYKLSKFIQYINISKQGIQLYKNNFKKSINPDVSVIISLYNRDKYINSTICSVQNQRMKFIEIIIVDDHSTDKSVKYIEYAQKIDPRIILIKNEKNMGALYTKSLGVLYSKGKYILSLDSDDMICIEDYIKVLYKKAIVGNYDYIECNEYIEINLRDKTIKQKESSTMLLWVKLIKKSIYKNIINKIGKNALKKGITTLDDNFILLFLKDNRNFKKVDKIGVFHYKHFNSQIYASRFSNKENTFKFCRNVIKAIDTLFDISGDNVDSKNYKSY